MCRGSLLPHSSCHSDYFDLMEVFSNKHSKSCRANWVDDLIFGKWWGKFKINKILGWKLKKKIWMLGGKSLNDNLRP